MAPGGASPAPVSRPRDLAGYVLRLRGWIGYHLSVRWKLTLWYTVMYAVTLLAVGFALPPLLRYETDQSIDASMVRTAHRVINRINETRPFTGPVYSSDCHGQVVRYCGQIELILDKTSSRLSAPGQFTEAVIIGPAGVNLLPPHPAVSIPIRSLAVLNMVMKVIGDGRPRFLPLHVAGQDVRVYFAVLHPPASAGPNTTGVLEVYQIEADFAATERALSITLLLMAPFALAICLILGWWVARAALRPIGRISRTVGAIGESRDLGRRLAYRGPQDEIGRLAGTFDGMMARLEAAFEAQRRFVADASHELRTPLTAIRGNADLMAIAPPSERELCLAAIRRESERMSRLVSDLLLLAEADTAEAGIRKQTSALDEIVAEAAHSLRVTAGDRVNIMVDVEPVTAEVDPDRISQLLLNLSDNAVKFTPPGGTVTLRLRRDGGEAVLEVEDTGIGIPPEEHDAIFRRFYRVDTSRSTHGTGLGLAISGWIATAHGGTISVRSSPGRGSTFSVRLPAAAGLSSQPADYSKTSAI
ncbi:MAG TPA: HAMP domain-containing sensor histidine kinase [Chloroflexota bacterium]|nr:HAMP domain-containing sensor histidine kinase [Chloroflexota bacterium]